MGLPDSVEYHRNVIWMPLLDNGMYTDRSMLRQETVALIDKNAVPDTACQWLTANSGVAQAVPAVDSIRLWILIVTAGRFSECTGAGIKLPVITDPRQHSIMASMAQISSPMGAVDCGKTFPGRWGERSLGDVDYQQLKFHSLARHPEYVPLVIRWWHSVWNKRMGSDFRELEIYLHRLLAKRNFPLHLLAFIDEQPVAVAALKLHELESLFPHHRYWLGSVFVSPDFRGQKLGSTIVRHMEEVARERHLPQLYLQTQNLSGGLYESLGWEPLQRLEVCGEETLLMVKRLNENS